MEGTYFKNCTSRGVEIQYLKKIEIHRMRSTAD